LRAWALGGFARIRADANQLAGKVDFCTTNRVGEFGCMVLTHDERIVLDQFCTNEARLHLARMNANGLTRGIRLTAIVGSLIAKGFLAATPNQPDTFHLTKDGVDYCGRIENLPHVKRGD
jgi:hypothetical protein